jgi:hypothetical protein
MTEPVKKRQGLPKKAKTQSVKLFDFLNDIMLEKKNILNSDNNYCYSKYMITRFLSMIPEYLPIVEQYLNRYQGSLDNYAFHKLCIAVIPNRKVYINYSKTVPLKNVIKDDLKYIVDYFEISENQAYEYYELGGDDLVVNIKKLHGVVE